MMPIVRMSRAIRGVLEEEGPTIRDIPTATLSALEIITAAFAADMRVELQRRAAAGDSLTPTVTPNAATSAEPTTGESNGMRHE